MAVKLGADQVVVWSPYDGYDYYLQVRCTYELGRVVKKLVHAHAEANSAGM
jgi:hypothetical protein